MCTRMENSLLNPGATADGIQVDRLAVPTWILGSERDETPAGESFDTEQRGIPQQIRFQVRIDSIYVDPQRLMTNV